MRKVLLFLVLAAALAAPTGAWADKKPNPDVICENCGGGLGGWTGCTQQTESHSASIPIIASVRHYLVVNYCKSNGVITSISIAAHGCDAGGLIICDTGPAWMTEGGTGWGYASFEAHASWLVVTSPWYNNYDTLTLSVPLG